MTAARWAKLESSLWRLFDSLSNWKQDAPTLRTTTLVDHIEVSIRATQMYLTAAQTLLMNETLTQNDLELEIVLRYMSQEDSTALNAQPMKRKHDVETKPTQLKTDGDYPVDSSSDIKSTQGSRSR